MIHGVDIVSVHRIGEMLRDHGERFLDRCFTGDERAYAMAQSKASAQHLAARFAAKEAVMKALGTGLSGGIAWTDVEVVRTASGQPEVRLSGRAAEVAREMGVASWVISLSHTREAAVASVIGLRERR